MRLSRCAVLDPVDASTARDRVADLRHEREVVAAAPTRAKSHAQPVVVDVVGAEDVAGAMAAVIARALAFGSLQRRPAGTGHRPETERAHLIERDSVAAVRGRRGTQCEHARGLGLIVGVGLAFRVRVR